MGVFSTDNGLHLGAGALMAAVMVLWPSPVSTLIVFSLFGLLREQAQKNLRGLSFRENWIEIWNRHKLIEGLSWGVGGLLAHLTINILR
tara:strand:+ start:448 stop:714 length:267 start_codon:yes stop_codon:yes gene_type:complete